MNLEGWYIYGVKDEKGVFVTQAIAPRRIFQLNPDSIYLGLRPGLNYINEENWKNTPAKKGTAKTVLLDPTAKTQQDALLNLML